MSNELSSKVQRCLPIVFFGILLSLYLVYHTTAVRGDYLVGESACNLGGKFNCDAVAASAYAVVGGVQVASLGLWYYLFFMLMVFLVREHSADESKKGDALFFLASLSIPPTIYFLSVSLFKIGFVCIFCLLTYLINVLLVAITWPRERGASSLLSRLRGGGEVVASIFLSSKTAAFHSVLSWLFLLGAGFVACALPNTLRQYYFEPRAAELADEKYLADFVTAWEKQTKFELPVSRDTEPMKRDFVLGPDSAPLTLVEFLDFQCPYCKRASKYVKPLVEKFKGDLRVVFKNFPLDSDCNPLIEEGGHAYACQAAIVARCAGMQGDASFWKMYEAIFALDAFDWSVEALMELPSELGLDVEAFDGCMSDPQARERVVEDVSLGNSVDVQGTPSLYVNGRKLSFTSLEQLEGLIGAIRNRSAR